jgi:hypothetical protein
MAKIRIDGRQCVRCSHINSLGAINLECFWCRSGSLRAFHACIALRIVRLRQEPTIRVTTRLALNLLHRTAQRRMVSAVC